MIRMARNIVTIRFRIQVCRVTRVARNIVAIRFRIAVRRMIRMPRFVLSLRRTARFAVSIRIVAMRVVTTGLSPASGRPVLMLRFGRLRVNIRVHGRSDGVRTSRVTTDCGRFGAEAMRRSVLAIQLVDQLRNQPSVV